jgi:hypothetical protein
MDSREEQRARIRWLQDQIQAELSKDNIRYTSELDRRTREQFKIIENLQTPEP